MKYLFLFLLLFSVQLKADVEVEPTVVLPSLDHNLGTLSNFRFFKEAFNKAIYEKETTTRIVETAEAIGAESVSIKLELEDEERADEDGPRPAIKVQTQGLSHCGQYYLERRLKRGWFWWENTYIEVVRNQMNSILAELVTLSYECRKSPSMSRQDRINQRFNELSGQDPIGGNREVLEQ